LTELVCFFIVALGAHGVKSKINIPTEKNTDPKKSVSPGTSLAKEILIVMDATMGIMSFNGEARKVLGSILEHGSILLIDHFIREIDCEAVRDAIHATFSNGAEYNNISVWMKTTKGRHIPIVFSTYPLYFDHRTIQGSVLSFRGLEDRKTDTPSEHNALIEQKSLLEALPEGVFTINTKWQIASFNKTAEKITGYTKQEVLGRYCWEIFRSDLCELGCPLKDALETGKLGSEQDVRILKKGDGPRTILVNTGVLRDDQGLIVGAIETFRTLTGGDKPTKNTKTFSDIIGQSKVIQRLFKTLPDIAASEANVFLTGESGTGKELFARAIHDNSSRAKHPFIAVNCSALAETLLESELFGHEKSAFTGATKTKPGRFELVKQGTLFLDEIGELKPSLQIKLLRVLEQREFERVGGTIPIQLKARIISATNKDLLQAMEDGSFRKDFYYRLRTVPMVIPPLRERKEDIPLLVSYFIRIFNVTFKKNVRKVDTEVMELLLIYHWPGNVKELERTIEHAFVFVKGPIILFDNLPQIDVFTPITKGDSFHTNRISLTREKIVQALAKANGKKKDASLLLGISRTSLWRKMKAFNLLD
jgi:PAS domain S-box-containing protein